MPRFLDASRLFLLSFLVLTLLDLFFFCFFTFLLSGWMVSCCIIMGRTKKSTEIDFCLMKCHSHYILILTD
jgi:hypothetical protein